MYSPMEDNDYTGILADCDPGTFVEYCGSTWEVNEQDRELDLTTLKATGKWMAVFPSSTVRVVIPT